MKKISMQLNFLVIQFLIIVGLFAGCSKRMKHSAIKKISTTMDKQHISLPVNYQEVLALHSQIPDVMTGFQVTSLQHDQADEYLIDVVYKPYAKTNVDHFKIAQIYDRDMEMLGWKKTAQFSSNHQVQQLYQRLKSNLVCNVTVTSSEIKVTILQNKNKV